TAVGALSIWAKHVGIYPATLSGIERAGDAKLSAATRALAAANYSPSPEAWNGSSLHQAVANYGLRSQSASVKASALSPLHPVSS
ncbi:MAG: hypothetical protein ACPG47_03900, partial [Leucothrix sp.]